MTVTDYLNRLVTESRAHWNAFWMSPSSPGWLHRVRVLAGLIAIAWLVSFTADLTVWLSPQGWLPPAALSSLYDRQPPDLSRLSLLRYVSHPFVLWACHLLAAAMLACFTAGMWTRWTSWAALAVVLTYLHRTPLIHGAAEVVLATLFLYLPLVDWPARPFSRGNTWRLPDDEPPSLRTTIARRLLQVHLVILYLVIGLTQLAALTWWQGEAIWWLSAQPLSRLVDLTWLSDHPYVLNLWTLTILISELAFAILIWVPLLRPLLLTWMAVVWMSVGIAAGDLPLAVTLIAANLVFVPEPRGADTEPMTTSETS